MYMLFTDYKSVSSMYKVIYVIDMPLSGLSLAHTEFCILYICFLQPLLGLSVAHIE